MACLSLCYRKDDDKTRLPLRCIMSRKGGIGKFKPEGSGEALEPLHHGQLQNPGAICPAGA